MRVALWRAAHTFIEQPPHVLEDQVGYQLGQADEVVRTVLDTVSEAADDGGDGWLRTEAVAGQHVRPFRAAVVARARFIEDLVQELLLRDVRHHVILGAGLDSFALRHPELSLSLDVFEVDDAGAQAWKRARLAELGLAVPPNLYFASADFEANASFMESLGGTRFDL